MKKIEITTILLIIIVFLGAIVRIYNVPYRYSLGEETVRDAVVAIEAARQIQLPLTGAFSSLGPFTFGPLYTYQMAFFTFIFRHGYSPWIYLTILAILYILVMYEIGKILEGKTFGLLLALITALSPTQIISATHLTSHNNTNIFAVLAIFVFLKIMLKNISLWWGFLLGVVLGIGINLHYQMMGLFVLPIALLFYKPKKYLYFINSIVGIFITFIPLIIFELNNHWFNIRNMIYYFLYGKNAIYVPNRWLFYVRDFWPSFWADAFGIPSWAGMILMGLSFFLLGYLSFKRKLQLTFVLLLICFIANFILLRYYWGPRFFGYLNFLRPFVFIFTSFFIYRLSKLKFGVLLSGVICILLLFGAYPRIRDQFQRDPFTMRLYKNVSVLENKYSSKKIALYGCNNYYRGGYDAITFSTVFLLDLKKINGSDVKIALESQDCEIPDTSKISHVSETGYVDITNLSDIDLKRAGWQQVTFNSIYEHNARWWLKEQP